MKLDTPTQEVQEVSMTEDQAANALLERWGAKESQSNDEPTEESSEEVTEVEAEGEQEQSDAEPEEQAEEAPEESGEIEIDVAGEKFKLPPALAEQAKRIEAKAKEVEAGATRKFQEAAEIRKSAEKQFEVLTQLQQVAQQNASLLADHKMVSNRLAQLEQVNVQQLAETDPVALTKLNAEFNQLSVAKQRIEQAYQQSLQASEKAKGEYTAEKLTRLNTFAKQNIKGWNEDYSNKLLDFVVKDVGFDPGQIQQMIDEPLIKLIDLAYQGQRMRKAEPMQKRVQSTKTLKPGSNTQAKTVAADNAEKAFKRLKASGSVQDAAMALLARSNTKRR